MLDLLKYKKNNLDAPKTTLFHAKLIKQKIFLRNIYIDFYRRILNNLNKKNRKGFIVEIGSGGGFIKEIIPQVKTSDLMSLPNIDFRFSALKMPFKKDSINAFVMIDVLHHIPNADKFFEEVCKRLKNNGQLIMIEPANTFWGKFIYQNFHHERFDPKGNWTFKSSSPLFSANGALPWIIFIRDRDKFQKKFPHLKINILKAHTPFSYLISGGLSYHSLLPGFAYPLIHLIESILAPLNNYLGMFYTISLEKVKNS